MGKKRIPDLYKKDKQVIIRMTQSEYDSLKRLADGKNKTISGLVRKLVMDEYIRWLKFGS